MEWIEVKQDDTNISLGEYYQMELERRRSPIYQFWKHIESEEYKKDWEDRYYQDLKWYEQ